jgi:hypothetical protein
MPEGVGIGQVEPDRLGKGPVGGGGGVALAGHAAIVSERSARTPFSNIAPERTWATRRAPVIACQCRRTRFGWRRTADDGPCSSSLLELRRFRGLFESGAMMSLSKIARETGLDGKMARKYLAGRGPASPPRRASSGPRRQRVVDEFAPLIDSMLRVGILMKAVVIHERLARDYGFTGNYQRVKLYVQGLVAEAAVHRARDGFGANVIGPAAVYRAGRFLTRPGTAATGRAVRRVIESVFPLSWFAGYGPPHARSRHGGASCTTPKPPAGPGGRGESSPAPTGSATGRRPSSPSSRAPSRAPGIPALDA